jgi:hypothetical protein
MGSRGTETVVRIAQAGRRVTRGTHLVRDLGLGGLAVGGDGDHREAVGAGEASAVLGAVQSDNLRMHG